MAAKLDGVVWVEADAEPETTLAALDRAGEWIEVPLAIGHVSSDNRRFAQAGFRASASPSAARRCTRPATRLTSSTTMRCWSRVAYFLPRAGSLEPDVVDAPADSGA